MKKILLALLALVVIAAVGYVAASRVWGFPVFRADPEDDDVLATRLGIISLGQFVTNLADGGRYIRVTVDLEVDADKSSEVTERTSELKTDVYAILRGRTYTELSGEAGLRLLQKQIRDQMEVKCPGVVKNIYFSEFVVQ